MQFDDYQVFLAMYQILDTSYRDNRLEKTLSFISDADPNVWEGRCSGDPAVFVEFEEMFAKRFPEGAAEAGQAFAFVREYLELQNKEYDWNEGDLTWAFESGTKLKPWEDALLEIADVK